ncbi:MAG: type II secretion system protein [Sedimentisphaerales bacterium]|nr:type II secretion system protein [Sedimentisphaerales bacterium]
MKKKGFTLIELLVVIAIIAMLLAILMPALNKVKKIAQRVVCGTNLKGLGTAQSVYANDYEDQYTRAGGGGSGLTWNYYVGGWQQPVNPWQNGVTDITVGASLYLLVREADVSPKSFICTAGGQTAYDGTNSNNLDLVELWDFGTETLYNGGGDMGGTTGGPRAHVSYGFHDPYGRFAASGTSTASFAVMADKNPWFDPKLTEQPDKTSVSAENYVSLVSRMGKYWDGTDKQKYMIQVANAYPHGREGQNVLFGDGHCNYEKEPDVGVRHDNIYTYHLDQGGDAAGWRCGDTGSGYVAFGAIDGGIDPMTAEDSFLVNDDDN